MPVDFDSKADYDNDGKPNDEEVNWNSELIKNEKLPSILECMRSVEKPYVEQGLDRYIQSNINNLYSNLENVYILPIRSDPLSIDGDGDGFWDYVNNNLSKTYIYEIDDPQPLCRNKIDKYTIERIQMLHPKAQKSFLEFILVGQTELSDVTIRITDHYRTIEEQNELYEQGRTKPGLIVTWVKGGDSYHNYGLAMDIAFIDGNGKLLYDDTYYSILKNIYSDFNLEWGGEWKETPDKPHYQMTFNYSCSDLLKKYNNDEVDGNGYVVL